MVSSGGMNWVRSQYPAIVCALAGCRKDISANASRKTGSPDL